MLLKKIKKIKYRFQEILKLNVKFKMKYKFLNKIKMITTNL